MDAVQRQVLEFFLLANQFRNSTPGIIPDAVKSFRERLIREEVTELLDAMASNDVVAVAKELADVLYVVYGTAIAYGFDMEPISAEVHRSNMTKFGKKGEHSKDKGGKVKKSPTYEKLRLQPIITEQVAHGLISL